MTLNFLHMNAARIIGGVIGGSLLAIASPAYGFAAAAILAAVPAVLMSRLPRADADAGGDDPRSAARRPDRPARGGLPLRHAHTPPSAC